MSSTFNNLILADGETLIRSYEASHLDHPKATGYLIATNRRLMFIGESSGAIGESVMHREVNIVHVNGLYAYYDTGKSFGILIFAAILTLIFILLAFASPVFIVGLLWPAYIVYKFFTNPTGRNAQMQVAIMADGAQSSPISFGQINEGGLLSRIMGLFGASGNNAWMSVIAGPGRDAAVLVRELGALVLDIQTLGDHALEKWNERPAPAETRGAVQNLDVGAVGQPTRESWNFDQ